MDGLSACGHMSWLFTNHSNVFQYNNLNEEAEYKRAWPGQSRVRLI